MTPTGFDSPDGTTLQDNDLGNLSQQCAAESGAAGHRTGSHGAAIDPGLQRVVEAWPRLPEQIRRAVLALVESGTQSD
jgi:hypothetical protein